jgi:hypothetical protein
MTSRLIRRIFICAVFVGILIPATAQEQDYRGTITGNLFDAKTREPLVGVNIVVVGREGLGTASDPSGSFVLADIEVGTYTLRFSAVGYETKVVTNVVVTTGRRTSLHVELQETILELEEITVRAQYFTREKELSPLSVSVLDRSEIRRSPGSVQDVQRVVQSLPGVASSTDNINELIVRGGAPYENLIVLDNMEIPSINHYSNQFNSAGPINMVNADMIRDVQFSSGGYTARFGDKSSSVMNIAVREGNRNTAFSSLTYLNMAGIGTLAEGGFAGGRGSYIVSARKSFLEILDNMIGLSAISLTAVPRYWDVQAKTTFDLTPGEKLSLNFLYGESRITVEGDPLEANAEKAGRTDSSAVERVYPFNKQLVAGLTWQSLWSNKGFSTLTLYTANSEYDADVYEDFTARTFGTSGEVLEYRVLNTSKVFFNRSQEAYVAAKWEVYLQMLERHELWAGVQVQTAASWKNEYGLAADTARYDLNGDGFFETGPVVTPAGSFQQSQDFGRSSKYFLYVSDKIRLSPRLSLTAGVRYDHFTYPGQGALSPRLSLSVQLIPHTTTVTLATGRYPQSQPFPYYSDRRQLGYNRHLEHMIADHAVVGFEHILDQGLRFTLEAYYKKYSKVVVSEGFVYSAVDTFWSDRALPIGERRSYGLELFLEKKQIRDLFGTLSISLSKTRDKDVRRPPLVDDYPSDYDYTLITTLVAGHVVRGVRDWLDETPFFIKYPSYLLLFSNEIEVSVKYRYQTGRVYTPQEFVRWKQVREGGLRWSEGAWVATDRINAERYPDYSRLDLQWLSRFYFQNWNINVYIALQNVLNRKNVFYQNYRSDGTIETVYQFAFFPVFGIEVEF